MFHPARWAALLAAGLIAGCTTPYGAKGITGGYHDEQIDATHYRVTFDGNGYTQKDQVWSFWIYRCAELTRSKGYHYFTLSKDFEPLAIPMAPAESAPAAEHTALDVRRTHAGTSRALLVERRGDGIDAGTGADGGRATIQRAGFYYYSYTITTWHSKGVVAMYNAPVAPVVGAVMDAQVVLDQLEPYVHGQQHPPLSREALVRAGMRWIDDDGRPTRFMTFPALPAPAASSPAAKASPASQRDVRGPAGGARRLAEDRA